MNRRPAHTNQDGIALVAAIMVGLILVILSTLLLTISMSEATQSNRQVRMTSAAQAAEAGIDDYLSKLTQNRYYHMQFVHPAERARTKPSGAVVLGGQPWSGGNVWAYAPGAATTWRKLGNGFEYSLQVKPPKPGDVGVTVRSTGRKVDNRKEMRTYEARIRSASVLDYQRIVQGDAHFNNDAITNGKIYIGGDLWHPGTAQANVYVEGSVKQTPTLEDGAQIYDNTTIRSVIPEPIDFTKFTVQLPFIQASAQAAGIYLDGPASVTAWRLRFNANGTVTISRCTGGPGYPDKVDYWAKGSGGGQIACTGGTTTTAVPDNGAIFSSKLVMLSGKVNGRITVGSEEDIILEGPLSYVDGLDDTIGMIPKYGFRIAYYAYYLNGGSGTLEWWGSVLVNDPAYTWGAQADIGSGSGPPGLTSMIHHGSVITPTTGNMAVIPNRTYMYDPNLQFLMPPFFPVLDDVFTVDGFREVPTNP